MSFLVLATAGWLTGDEGYFWAATASIWTCLADRQGTWRERLWALASVGFLGAGVSAVGAAVATTPWLALVIVIAAGLAAGLTEVRGPVAALSAKLLYVVLVASCLLPVSDPNLAARAVSTGISFLHGGVVACLICLMMLPSRRDTRPRPEVAAVFTALLQLARMLDAALPGGDTTATAATADAKREVRKNIEAARHALLAIRPRFGAPASLLYHSYAVSLADAVFALLIVALELRARGQGARLPANHILRSIEDMQEQVDHTMARAVPDLPALCAALHLEVKRLHAPIRNASAPPVYQSALAALATFPRFDAWQVAFRWPRRGLRQIWLGWRRAVAEHTASDTRAARHAVRLAFAGALSLIPAQIWHLEHGYWVPVTVIMVLSPQLQSTRHISRQRFAGSLAGAAIACAVGLAHPGPAMALAMSAACLSIAYAARLAGRPGSFALFLTPAVILFSWVGQPSSDSSHFAAVRGFDTALGCLIALASYYLLTPRPELSRLYRHSLDALAVNTVYLRAAFSSASPSIMPLDQSMHSLTQSGSSSLEALRVAAGRASSRAEETLLQAATDVAPALAKEYRSLHGTLRQMAALAGLVRAGLAAPGATETGDSAAALAASDQTRALLTQVEARLSELAVRPGGYEPAQRPETAAGYGQSDEPHYDGFLHEQAAFAHRYADAAHAAVAAVRSAASVTSRRWATILPRLG